jgi:hypothetical protein
LNTKLHADQPWGTYFIVTVMEGFLSVFKDIFPDHFSAKEFLLGISRIVKARIVRSHQDEFEFKESDVVDALYQMSRVLQLTGNAAAAAKMDSLLEETSRDLEKCRTYIVAEQGQTIQKDLSKEAYKAQLLYLSRNAFEVHLEIDEVAIKGLSRNSCPMRPQPLSLMNDICNPSLFSFMIPACDASKKRKWENTRGGLAGRELMIINDAKHWYYHHLPRDPDVAKVLKAMDAACSALAKVQQPAMPWEKLSVATTGAVGSFTSNSSLQPSSSIGPTVFVVCG